MDIRIAASLFGPSLDKLPNFGRIDKPSAAESNKYIFAPPLQHCIYLILQKQFVVRLGRQKVLPFYSYRLETPFGLFCLLLRCQFQTYNVFKIRFNKICTNFKDKFLKVTERHKCKL